MVSKVTIIKKCGFVAFYPLPSTLQAKGVHPIVDVVAIACWAPFCSHEQFKPTPAKGKHVQLLKVRRGKGNLFGPGHSEFKQLLGT